VQVYYPLDLLFYFIRSHPWSMVTQAVFSKYPNPISTHVLATDIIFQQLVPLSHIPTSILDVLRSTPSRGLENYFKNTENSRKDEDHYDDQKILYTRKLILKTSKVPFWAAALIPRAHGYVLEQSWVHLPSQTMLVHTDNLSYAR
jgi:PRELI-like family